MFVPLYILFCITYAASENDNITEVDNNRLENNKETEKNVSSHRINIEATVKSDHDKQSCDIRYWNTFLSVLMNISKEQLIKIPINIKNNYILNTAEKIVIDGAFINSLDEYVFVLQVNLKKLMDDKKFNTSEEFMLDFMDLSNSLVAKIVEYNLGKVQGAMFLPTQWYKQTLKHKIQRQQTKVAINNVESYVCDVLDVCKERYRYSQYLVDWIRQLMGMTSKNLKDFFSSAPETLEKHKYFVISNIKFRQTIKYITDSIAAIQRDTLDFVDEVITNQVEIYNLAPDALKKSVVLLKDLFKLIDGTYNLSDENEQQLNAISNKLTKHTEGNNIDLRQVLDAIVENIHLNFQIWPLDKQNRMYYIWSKVILL